MKEKSLVAIVPCEDYENENVYDAVKKGLELLGGLSELVQVNDEVLVKTNMLSSANPEKAITTHPAVFEAVVKCLKDEGAKNLYYGDSSGNPMSKMEDVAKTCGIYGVAQEYGMKDGGFDDHFKCDYPQGHRAKSFELCKAAKIEQKIEICKMKTHALENITGAVKNQYGFVFGAHKAKGHATYPNSRQFAEMLVDLNKVVDVDLHIMDGVIAMEGNGPASGEPTPMKVLLMSKDPVALDSVFARLVYLDPEFVPTCVAGEKLKLGNMNFENIEIVCPDGIITSVEAASRYGNAKFQVNRKKVKFWNLKGLTNLYDTLVGQHFEKPILDRERCVGCGLCEQVCPVDGKAVMVGADGKARYNYKKCIRCYCCQEMCPEKAIKKSGR